jgi:hypothetical protein
MPKTSKDPSSQSLAKPEERKHSNSKRRGEVAELAFMHKAADLGFAVTKPYGDSEPYDFILDAGQRLWRVQVRSTSAPGGLRGYFLRTVHGCGGGRRMPYDASQIDFLVAYVIPYSAWYVIPISFVGSRRTINLYPNKPKSRAKWEKFREAWCLMACPFDGTVNPDITVQRRCAACPHRQSSI